MKEIVYQEHHILDNNGQDMNKKYFRPVVLEKVYFAICDSWLHFCASGSFTKWCVRHANRLVFLMSGPQEFEDP